MEELIAELAHVPLGVWFLLWFCCGGVGVGIDMALSEDTDVGETSLFAAVFCLCMGLVMLFISLGTVIGHLAKRRKG